MPRPPVPAQASRAVSEPSFKPGQEPASQRQASLDDRYLQEESTVLLTGIQALARLPMDQHRADKRKGLRTATLVSGYRGSPLGGLDQTLQRIRTC
jgi:indolepyruvate ferredoxin oxidoreductase